MHKRVVWTVKMAHQKRGWLSGLIQSLRTTLGINEHNWLRQVLFWLPPWYIKAPNHCGCAPSHILSTSSYQMQYYTCLLLRIWRTFLCIQRKFPSRASEHWFVFHTDLKPSQPHQNSRGKNKKVKQSRELGNVSGSTSQVEKFSSITRAFCAFKMREKCVHAKGIL